MPRGLEALERLSVVSEVPPDQCARFRGIRYVQEDGGAVEGRFPRGSGLGVRRIALWRAVQQRAREAGAEMRNAGVRGLAAGRLDTDAGPIEARLIVAADGLNSALRRAAGLEVPVRGPRRFGIRRHFRVPPWSDLVEVHWSAGAEAYVTPVGPRSVNVAFLWQEDALSEKASFESLLDRFPALADRVRGATVESESRGAGPLSQRVKARTAAGLALIGDAAGYVDAITGQGLSLAFTSAELLVRALPRELREPALSSALRRYEASLRAGWLRYAVPARSLLALARRPALRRRALGVLQRHPRWFSLLLRAVA